MTVIGKTSSAFYFNGVSDSITCSVSDFSATGITTKAGAGEGRSSRPLLGKRHEDGRLSSSPAFDNLGNFSVEAWVRPDYGGVVASKDNLFTLTLGSIKEPSSASFTVTAQDSEGERKVYRVDSAEKITGGYNGVFFPIKSHGTLGNDDLSRTSAPLIHVAGVFTRERIYLVINGVTVASTKIHNKVTCNVTASDFLIGGKGGQFRGYIESVHWRRDVDTSSIQLTPSVKDNTTIGLWRFEEDIEVDGDIYYIKSNASVGDTTLTFDSVQIQTMYQTISGKSDTLSGVYNVPSLGKYKVATNTHSGGAQVIDVDHTPWNLIINATGTDVKTGKPNNSAPERVRITQLDASTNRITVNSVHLDFETSTDTGTRGVLHARTAFNSTNNLSHDSTCVLIKSDILVDTGTDDFTQMHGMGSQGIDTTGVVVKDDGPHGFHGYLFNRSMSINNTTNNPYSVSSANWGTTKDRFQVGHTARHCLNYVTGHDFLRVFPEGRETVTQTMDGLADIIEVVFDGNNIGLKGQVPVNTPISVYKSGAHTSPRSMITSSTAKQVIRNGLSTLDPDRDGIIAIGGSGFDARPFLLKGYPIDGVTQNDDVYNLHLTPEETSRIAVLETGDADFPLVEVHYNAVDLTGDTMGTSGPCLLVQKTVPAGGSVINGKRVAATIAGAISAGKTLNSPGGLLNFSLTALRSLPAEMSNYLLTGDNTGGTLYEVELDKSMIPSNYTPRVATDDPQFPPLGIASAHTSDSTHPSVYHKMIMRPNTTIAKTLISTDDEFALSATSGNEGAGNLVNRLFEVFDVITNYQSGSDVIVIVQPSDRTRSLVFNKTIDTLDDPMVMSTEFLISRGRIASFREGKGSAGSTLDMVGRGLMDDVASMEANFSGEGAPDSVVVKEVSPDSPVVSVTLGGAGQGAVLTQPTWDKSTLSRLGWNSRRDGGAMVRTIDNSSNHYVEVTNLNNNAGLGNNSDSLDAGGHFAPRGRLYVESGANFEYFKLSVGKFYFHSSTGHVGTGRFKDAEGIELDSFAAWQSSTGLAVGSTVVVDDKFSDDSIVLDGTTINDRLFQAMGSVSHDYQLGTQYASTRAMVEIPIFSNQFFNDPSAGSFPSPGNSMKLHVDTTMTAHTWAPNPVGRRPADFYPPDRDIEGPYHKRLKDGQNAVAARINKVVAPIAGTGSITSHSGTWGDSADTSTPSYTITDARGTVKKYIVSQGGTTGDVDGNGNVIIGETQGAFVAQSSWYTNFNKNFKSAIEHANGHNGSIVVEDFTSGTVLRLRETVYGNKSDDGTITSADWDTTNAPTITQVTRSGYVRIYVDGLVDRIDAGTTLDVSGTERKVKGLRSAPMYRRVFTPNGEWGLIQSVTDAAIDYLDVQETSKGFLDSIKPGSTISLLPYLDFTGTPIRDDSRGLSSANEFRQSFYYDRANVQTQGGNIDYGLRQYVSAIEFKAGPEANPHTRKIKTHTGEFLIRSSAGGANWNVVSDTSPISKGDTTYTAKNTRTGSTITFTHNSVAGDTITVTNGSVSAGDTLSIVTNVTNPDNQLSRTWNFPYAPGGLRQGDTVWMNMHYTNPHAIDGMFCKSRGVFNQYEVWDGFTEGRGSLTTEANSTLPLENFLIGNTCRETAANFAQHVNKSISLNWQQLGYTEASVPVVAYVDPYLDTDDHARVLLYDVAHDREFIAFHDLFMQVQTSQATPTVNGLDVAAGFKSQINTSNRSDFMESAYAHRSNYLMNPSVSTHDRDFVHDHYVDFGASTIDGSTGRTAEDTVSVAQAEARHQETTTENSGNYNYNTTFFDTPDGTRAIPAFLCLKGVRATAHDLSSHAESALDNLPHWTDMDFVRRHTIDFGEVAIADGVSDIESAAAEVVRQVNQSAALQATSAGGSAHDPAAFWDTQSSASNDRGTHMGYVRAHIGRPVKDLDGREGYTVIIHSTIPGASGRNFCAWLDNSTGQVPYRPEFLIGHGGRFRNSWCLPPEGEDENMHPAPMPINKHGRPFAPITTLRQLVPTDEDESILVSNLHFGYDSAVESTDRDGNDEMTTGRAANTVYGESFEPQGESRTLVEGLRTGTRARARINFGGLVASGVPGWAPDAGKWGCGEDGQSGRFDNIYANGPTSYSAHVPNDEKSNVGDRDMYGFRFTDHRNVDHTVRLVYRQEGKPFSSKATRLPSTIENEVLIYFDDRDVSQGGFTIGKNMMGSNHPDRADFPAQSWRGNEWKGVKAPANGYAVRTQKAGSVLTLHTIVTPVPSYVDSSAGGGAIDTLGFLGFPDSGMLVYTDVGSTTTVVHYTSRTHNDDSGPHKFYGVTGPNFSSASVTQWATSSNTGIEGTSTDPAIISPSLNWTTILTDEVIAAAVEHALSVDPNDRAYLDISDMYATDGKTFKEWMGDNAKTAICVTTLNDKQYVTPLRDLFRVERRRDLGLLASCLEHTTTGTSQLTLAQLEAGKQDAVGYLPFNILDISTSARGPNTNTATPLLVNSANQAVDVSEWKRHLKGDKYMSWPGDHILPCIETHTVRTNGTVVGTTYANKKHSNKLQMKLQKHNNSGTGLAEYFLGGPLLGHRVLESSYPSYVEQRAMYIDEDTYALGFFEYDATLGVLFTFDAGATNSDGTLAFSVSSDPSFLYSQFSDEFAGYRLAGNVYGEPLTYFRGGQRSPDHSVPLYFGGGFSGLVMDINDGTQNDYTEFYSHPYAAGPTGCAGLQNVGENMGAHAILDTTAMLAMFPGTALLNQHRGENTPPFMNSDAVLAPDLKAGSSAQTLGISSSDKEAIYQDSSSTDDAVPLTHPTPVVLRFAHPYARYTDTTNEVAYVVFGPGQSVPKHFNQYTGAGTVEPAASQTVVNKVTHIQRDTANVYYSSGTPDGLYLPNQMGKSNTARTGIRRYMPPTLLYQKTHTYPYSVMRNWEPAYGSPSSHVNQGDAEDAYLITNHFGDDNNSAATAYAHPFSYGTTHHTRWHMDGGFPAGGNWFDYAVRKNPPHPTTSESTKHLPNTQTHSLDSQTITLGLQASMFRVGYVALTTYDATLSETAPPADVFIVDATRVQNSEELGAVVSAAINSYPGEGNLKAIGGTFLPSFQDAVRQDRYSWVDLGNMDSYTQGSAQLKPVNTPPPNLPANGWLRLKKLSGSADGSNTNSFYGYYSSFTGSTGGTPISALSVNSAGTGYTNGSALSFSGGGGSSAAGTIGVKFSVVSLSSSGGSGAYSSSQTSGSLTFSGGSGSGAAGTWATSSDGAPLASVTVDTAGTGYTDGAAITVSGGGGSNAAGTIQVAAKAVASLSSSGGAGAYDGNQSTGNLTFSGGGGSGAAGTYATTTNGRPVSSITVDSQGSGYTSAPTVTIGAPNIGGGIQATAAATVLGGAVKSITITAAGSGYTSAPTVGISGGGGDGADASAVLGAEVRSLSSVSLTNGGSGYTSAPSVTTSVTDGGTVTATLAATGPVSGVTLSNNGSGYTSVPTVTASGGSSLALTGVLGTTTRSLSSVSLTNGGSGYSSAPTVSTGVGGGGTVTATLANTGPIHSVTLSNGGSGYTSVPTISIGGGGSNGVIGVTLVATGFFTLGANARSNSAAVENPMVASGASSDATSLSDTYQVLVWTKAGNLRWSNGAPETLHNSVPTSDTDSIYDQLAATQVHFSGMVDAIDRTRPIGAVGWHGERYSMLNSLVVPGTSKIASGLGAWHPALGTNPYGGGMTCHSLNGYPFVTANDTSYTPAADSTSTGVHPRHYVIISNEAELPIIARADRDGLVLAGDMLDKKWNDGPGGTIKVSHSSRHNNDRFVSYAHGGPHVDAQFAGDFSIPASGNGEWAGNAATTAELVPMETCIFPTGDLFFDKVENPGLPHYPDEVPLPHVASDTTRTLEQIYDAPFTYWGQNSAVRNFLSQHIVWKRMDGGNLCMPAPSARGLGAIPWSWRKVNSSYVKFGETIYGNNRFSFETTNGAMFPVVQAQELMQPHLAEQFPIDVKNALVIPNEEIQFQAITVLDDAGQEHKVEGGSPFGTIVRDFQRVPDRDIKGPALAGSGNEPNLKIRLPDPNTIPGNLVVRSGFDRVQAYQHESVGTGGLQRPDLPDSIIKSNFDSTNTTSDTAPFFENEGYERVDTRAAEYPYSREGEIGDQSFLETSYEPHDRGLFFHLTRKGFSYTERQPLGYSSGTLTHNPLTYVSVNTTTVTVNTSVNADIWRAEQLPDGRSFFTVNGHIVSFTGVSGSTFTGCKYSTGFTASAGDTLLPSFFVPAGTTRHFAARRLRDHAEVSGESPDKKPIDWMGIATNASPASAIRSDRLTPMPIPRMGHHYITPTMAMMPGHLSHPLYQRLYNQNRAYNSSLKGIEQELGYTLVSHSLTGGSNSDGLLVEQDGVGPNALLWFSSTSSPHPPSDIHGSGFTLMTETKMKYDGYGILSTATENATGGHRLSLEAGTYYRTHWNFPDPMETGAYQIIIQPNLYSQQLMGFNENYDFGADSGTKYPLLTDQQVATVVALQWNGTDYDFILAEAIQADVRGCEVYLNEVMLDIDPSPNQQFTNLPPLALYNPLGINENTSPIWSRKSLPYRPGMFRMASPGYTITVPWWAPALKSSDSLDASNAYRMVEWHRPEDYYLFSRSGYGSIGSQNVMKGYPSHFLHPYTHSYMSHVAITTVKATDQGNTQLIVENNSLFPEVGSRYMGHRLLVKGSDGISYLASYTHRGVSSGAASQTTNVFYGVTADDATQFWAACTAGAKIKLTGEHGTYLPSEVYTDKTASVLAQIITDLQDGTQDTQTGHLPDAYLSMWHYNLGRPMTFYSDSRSNIGDAAVDKKPYNHLPEHFETIRYQNFTYAVSDGPFDFRGFARSTTSGPTDNSASPDTLSTPQSRTDTHMGSDKKHHYGAFWPGGSRFGAQGSDLALWGTAGPGWGRYWDNSVVYQESGTAGQYEVRARNAITDSIDSTTHLRHASFGYRFCVRQAPNRPKWALWSTQAFDDKYVNNHSGYRFGAYVQSDAVTTTQFSYTSSLGSGTSAIASGHVGMLERLTNASALVGSDLKLQQVKYSHGRRMTRPFGCAVRNYIAHDVDSSAGGPHPVVRAHQGDWLGNMGSIGGAALPTACKAPRRGLAPAIAHYMTDWWGNTTGEEVRRFPIRGFGVRPAWDPEDSYRATDRTKTPQTFAAPANNGLSRANLDLFDPATAKRVGDRGDGRGVRWPTVFNEDVLQDVDIEIASSGLMLSHATSEPPKGVGYVRPRNDSLQITEVKRGISSRLDVAADDGLLKPEAMAGANVEKATADLLPASETLQEPISRIAPRIGLDVITVGEVNDTSQHDYVAIATEAHSLHTDRGAGKRYILAAGVKTDTRALDDYRLDSLNFSNFKQVMRLNHTHGLWPLGGNLIMDLANYMEPISDLGWGNSDVSGSNPVHKTSNPYQTADHNSKSYRTNDKDRTMRFLIRPVRVLDHRHVEVFRDTSHALSGTAAGRYGVFSYDTPNARAVTSSKFLRVTNPSATNAPYPPTYFFTSDSYTVPSSTGPRIQGSESSSFSNSLKQSIARIVVANNTLQHMRADAAREGDFSIQPRYTQSIYPGDNLNKSAHGSESSRSDNEVNG